MKRNTENNMDYEKMYKDALEDFVDIQGYEGLYMVNSAGEIYSLISNKLLRAGCNKQGYKTVVLCKDGKEKSFKVHRLVALAFIPNPNNYPCINHKDEDKTNNDVKNLEWCTHKYNVNYGTARKRLSETLKNDPLKMRKPVVQLSLSGDFLKEYRSTKEAGEITGIDRRQISRSINNVGKQAQGYLWVMKDEYDEKIDYGEIHRKESIHPKPKRIAQFTRDGRFIKEWESLTEAHNSLGIGFSSLTSCLYGKFSQAGGYVWKFIKE